jgi:hypothetical protein
MYRNSEGFRDPTAGAAISNVMKEYRQQRREAWKKETEIKERSKVYIASRYAGDVEKNTADAAAFCREAVRKGYIPIASHLLYPRILDDTDPHERELGLLFGQALLSVCDEVWFIGPKQKDGKIEMSDGMKAEYREAMRLKKKIRFFDREAMLNGR